MRCAPACRRTYPGATDTAIAATSQHKVLQMIKRYGEAADQRWCAPHQLKGSGSNPQGRRRNVAAVEEDSDHKEQLNLASCATLPQVRRQGNGATAPVL
jgi:hypothetical protein